MNLSWQDSVSSFLDTLATDPSGSFASFVDGVGAALWSAPSDGVFPSGVGSLLWSDGATPSDNAPALTFGAAEPTPFAVDSALPAAGLLWADPGNNTSTWSINDPWASQNGTFSIADLGGGAVSPLWQAVASSFAQAGAEMSPLFVSAFNDVSQVLWNAVGGTGQPPLLPLAPDPHVAGLAGSGGLPGSTLTPTQLVWTNLPGAAGLINNQMAGGVAPTPALGGTNLGFLVPQLNGPVVGGTGPHS